MGHTLAMQTERAPISDHDDDGSVWVRVPCSIAGRGTSLLVTAVTESLALDNSRAERLALLISSSARSVLERPDSSDGRLIELAVEVDEGLAELAISATRRGSQGPIAPVPGPGTVATRTELSGVGARLTATPDGGVSTSLTLPGGSRRNRNNPDPRSGPIRTSFYGSLFLRSVLPRALVRTAEDDSGGLESVSRIAELGDRIATTLLAADPIERLRANAARLPGALEIRLWELSEAQARDIEEMVRHDFPEAGIEGIDGGGTRARRNLVSISIPIASSDAP